MIIIALCLLAIIIFGVALDAQVSREKQKHPKYKKDDILYHPFTKSKAKVICQASLEDIATYYTFANRPYVSYWLKVLTCETAKNISHFPIAESSLIKM